MRFVHGLLATVLVIAAQSASRGDDTADFLKPDNWEGVPGLWTVANGSIVGETKEDPKYNNFLCSKQKYTDFELAFKVQLRAGKGNSGVQIRSKMLDDEKNKGKFVVAGPQADLGAKYWGSLYGEKFGGMMKASPSDFTDKFVKTSEFNDYVIKCVGKHVTITVNGQTAVDGDFEKLPDDGIIAFQIHAGFPQMRVEYKDVVFKNLGKK
jgi:hypothetical protein